MSKVHPIAKYHKEYGKVLAWRPDQREWRVIEPELNYVGHPEFAYTHFTLLPKERPETPAWFNDQKLNRERFEQWRNGDFWHD